jgi:hypothetical protein
VRAAGASGRRRTAASALIAAGAAAGLGAALLWPGSESASSTGATGSPELPASPAGSLDIPLRTELWGERHVAVWTTVRRSAVARSGPGARWKRITRLGKRTPEGTANTLLVLERAEDPRDRVWVLVRLALLPNGTTGWVPRARLGGYHFVRTRLRVNLRRRRATLLRNGRRIFRAPVGVGEPRWPTPRGRFYIRNKLMRYRSDFYGPLAFGTSARSAVLTDWPDGGFVGIHGTSRPDLVPGAVSHGCIRMRNRDILRLSRLMPVGTPLTIV